MSDSEMPEINSQAQEPDSDEVDGPSEEELMLMWRKRTMRRSSVFDFLQNSQEFRNVFNVPKEKLLEVIMDLETWEPPKHILEEFDYTFCGYDNQERPIWSSKMSSEPHRANLKPEDEAVLIKFAMQAAYRVMKSVYSKTDNPGPDQQAVFSESLASIPE